MLLVGSVSFYTEGGTEFIITFKECPDSGKVSVTVGVNPCPSPDGNHVGSSYTTGLVGKAELLRDPEGHLIDFPDRVFKEIKSFFEDS